MDHSPDIVICGAGIIGISFAYHLAQQRTLGRIWLVDERPPLSLTSDKSSECYRNWWPDPVMVALMNRSLDLMEELAEQTGNTFQMNRRGYLYFTADAGRALQWLEQGKKISAFGAGALRIHDREQNDYHPSTLEG
jgi:glycine/D-amino acid oxidase-like deaminating enzyme